MKKVESYRRLLERLTYIKRLIATALSFSALAKLMTHLSPALEKYADKARVEFDSGFIILLWLAALVTYVLLSEAMVQVNSKIRILENKAADKKSGSKFRRTQRKFRGVPPPS